MHLCLRAEHKPDNGISVERSAFSKQGYKVLYGKKNKKLQIKKQWKQQKNYKTEWDKLRYS